MKNKYTLNEIGNMLLNITNDLANFKKETRENFKQLNNRLDYIVKANNLKDLSKKKIY